MPVELTICIVVPIFKGMADMMNCTAVKLLKHGMTVVEIVFKRLQKIMTVKEYNFYVCERNN